MERDVGIELDRRLIRALVDGNCEDSFDKIVMIQALTSVAEDLAEEIKQEMIRDGLEAGEKRCDTCPR